MHTLTLENLTCLRVWFFFFILASWSNQTYYLHLRTFSFLCHSDYHSCNSHNCFSLCHYESVRRPSKSLNFAFPSWLFICHSACESIQGRILFCLLIRPALFEQQILRHYAARRKSSCCFLLRAHLREANEIMAQIKRSADGQGIGQALTGEKEWSQGFILALGSPCRLQNHSVHLLL